MHAFGDIGPGVPARFVKDTETNGLISWSTLEQQMTVSKDNKHIVDTESAKDITPNYQLQVTQYLNDINSLRKSQHKQLILYDIKSNHLKLDHQTTALMEPKYLEQPIEDQQIKRFIRSDNGTDQKLSNETRENEIKDILNLLQRGEQNLKYATHQDVILLLGNTGAGKSTLTQYLIGKNDNNLISQEIGKDTGEFIIVDVGENRISSNSTITSHTEFPELVLDTDTNTAFYDCPGFSDTRSAAHDISATYFTKKIIDSANAMKMVFTVSYPSVRQGVDRQDFMLLVKHAVSMIKNIDKFNDSIALIVTKVDNTFVRKGKKLKLVPNKSVIANIGTFLTGVKDELKTKFSKDQTFYENAVKFINILLTKNGENYTKIGIFRRPNKSGVVSGIPLLQNGKKSLEKILHKNLQFIIHDKDDFGYTISSDSQNYVHTLVEKINENIASDIKNLGDEIEEHYSMQEDQLHEIEVLYNKFKLGYDTLSATKTETIGFIELQDFVRQITKNINDLNISVSSKNLVNIVNYAQYLKFINFVSSQATVKPLEWAQGLTDIVEYLNDSQKWYDFLIRVHTILSTYSVQQDISRFVNVTDDLKRQIAVNGPVTESLKEFLDQTIGEDSKKEYNNIKNIKLNQIKLKNLSKILDLTLKYNTSVSCDNHKLIMKGQYVKLSDVKKVACTTPPKFIEIFALNKVLIDTDLDKTGEKVSLSIIAPIWDIIGTHQIMLDGKPAMGHYPTKAPNGIGPGSSGEDGKPGYPGGAAGTFLGIGKTFINDEHLSISANGGKGGPGQHGGDGITGKYGETFKFSRCPKCTMDEMVSDGTFTFESKTEFSDNRIFQAYKVYGTGGQEGGNGGDGGQRGEGGNPGHVNIIRLDSNPEIVVHNTKGSNGENGTGGKGGHGGHNGDLLSIECHINAAQVLNRAFSRDYTIDNFCTEKSRSVGASASSGRVGINGRNDRGIQQPEKAFQNTYTSHTINDYKNYFRENLSGNIRESYSREFINELEEQTSILDLYNTLGLVNELQGLEDQCYKLRTEISCVLFYKSLLRRISQYAEKPANYEKTIEYKKVLSYLYTATLSKINSMNNNVASNLVIDLQEYLNLVIVDINRLNVLTNTVTINEYQMNYQEALNEKTSEAEHFIDTQVKPEINEIFNQINNKVEMLINETLTLQNTTKEETNELLKQRQELGESLVLRQVLGITKIASQFLSFLGPGGAAASSAIGGGIMLYETLDLDGKGAQNTGTIGTLPLAVKNSVVRITDQLKNKQQLFREQIHDVEQKLTTFLRTQPSSDIEEIRKKISNTKREIDQEIARTTTLDPASVIKIHKMRKEVVELLGSQKKILEEQTPDIDTNIGKQLRMVNHVYNIVSIAEISIDVYGKIKNHEAQIDNVSNAIRQANTKLRKLEEYENDIYKIIIPICRNVENQVTTMEQNLKNKSHVALDISKWQIQSTLKDVKLQMKKMTEGFDVQEDLTRCIDKLEEGMSIMINVYDRIEDYHDKAKLAAYIADINSDRATAITINDEELKHAIDNLKLIIQSNLVLEKYEVAMNAFRQHMFPFADSFLAEYNLPASLKSNDPNSVMSNVVTKINNLKSKVSASIVTINKYDKYIHNNILFNSNSRQISPFYVWQHDSNKNTILKLLEGEEITIKADITQGLNKNAIKFNIIGIHFKLANEAIQHELDQQLQDFEVTMTHLGNSYYRCNNKFYVIPSDKQVFIYSLAKNNDNGEPLNKNLVYDKIKDNNPVLSPYAMWSIKLNNTRNNFSTLAKYKNLVIHLELEGRGQYVDQGIDVCNDNLNQYYMLDDTVSEINNIGNRQNLQEIFRTSHHRERRGVVDEHDLIQGIEDSKFVTNGASNNIKPSFINNIVSNSLGIFKGFNLIRQMTKWFIKDEKSNDQEVLIDLLVDNHAIDTNLLNIQFLPTELPNISNRLLEIESSSTRSTLVVDDTLIYNQGNLLLLDLLSRWKSGVKYMNKDIEVNNDHSCEYAQRLAYREYVPT